ncbi:helix-turn-helix domain-containing protein [Sneathiella chungangensis]|uniref:Helix-turn-helix domain-containing protein n=2 Tax=Sneathiella chungangensis TaxID=1418234 RepID=A0A845MD59_9PROT|nr:helix-turn-helix domain-containing protein [Sneathiella chungangensis]
MWERGMASIVAPKGSIARAARVLDVLSLAPDGADLTEIVARSNFTKTTTFRVLASLRDVNYVYQDPASRVYRLGSKLAELARNAERIDVGALAERGMKRLAEMSEDTVFLSVPEGASAICVSRTVGAFPIRTLTLDKGDRRPLGVGAGSLALFCSLPEEQRTAMCRVNQNWLADYGVTEDDLAIAYNFFQSNGYALNKGGVVSGMSAIAVPVVTASGRLVAALAIGAINERMEQARIDDILLPGLRREARRLADRLTAFEKEQSS